MVAEREAGARRAEAEATKRQREAAHNDAVAGFQTLLAETVKDPNAKWQVSSAQTPNSAVRCHLGFCIPHAFPEWLWNAG